MTLFQTVSSFESLSRVVPIISGENKALNVILILLIFFDEFCHSNVSIIDFNVSRVNAAFKLNHSYIVSQQSDI